MLRVRPTIALPLLLISLAARGAVLTPQISIQTDDTDAVRSALIVTLQSRGFALISDSPSVMVFGKPMEGFTGAFAQLALGNVYSTTPQLAFRFTIAKLKGLVQVTGFPSMSTQMRGGQVNSQNLGTDTRWARDMQATLNDVEASFTAPSPTAPALPAFPERALGITFDSHPQGAFVLTISSGSPAAKAGLVKGDVLSHLNGIALAGMRSDEIGRLITAAGDVLQLTSARVGTVTVEKADPATFAAE